MRRFAFMLLIVLFVWLFAISAYSQENPILWMVGKPDNDYAEFAKHNQDQYLKSFSGGAGFEIGKSNSQTAWNYLQPGSKDESWAGSGEHPFEVIFNLDKIPQGPYNIVLDLIDVNPDFPTSIRIRVNDKWQVLKLNPGNSKASLTDPKAGKEQIVKMCLAAGFMHTGRNVVNIAVVDGSWVLYDCVYMEQIKKAPHPADSLTAVPTFLYKKLNNELKQIIFASVEIYEDQPSVKVQIESEKGWKAEQVFTDVKSGRQDLDLEFPPVDSEQKVKMTVNVAGEVLTAECVVKPEKKWHIYLTPTAHFDYGYTGMQDDVLKLHFTNLENAMKWCDKYPGFVWNLEAAMVADRYLTDGPYKEKLIKLAQQGKIGVLGFYGNELTGICSNESLSRLMDYYDFLKHNYGIESKCVLETDVPTMVGTVPMILQGHGIKYLSHGVNCTRARSDQLPYNTPYYWESPDGSKVLTWKTGGYGQCGDFNEIEDRTHTGSAVSKFKNILDNYTKRQDYPYDAILLHGAYGDNSYSHEDLARVPTEWNKAYEYPKIIYSRGSEFFEYIESNYASDIKTYKGDCGVFWEDGAASSARETAISRVAKEKLVTAEKLVSLCDSKYQSKAMTKLDEAWKNALVYDEHTWGAAGSISDPYAKMTLDQWAVKKSYADKVDKQANELINESFAQYTKQIKANQNSVLVFNPSSVTRSETISLTAPNGKKLILFADSVPAMGYKNIPINKAKAAVAKPVQGDTLENQYYKITFDSSTGSVSSIFDKQLKRELVAGHLPGLNAYMYATGGEDSNILECGPKLADLTVQLTSDAVLQKTLQPGMQVMDIAVTAPMTKSFTSRVILYDNQKRIDFVNSMDKIENLKKEAGYFAFPFAFKNPTIRLEIPDGVIRPDADQLTGADRDWYCAQIFVTVSDDSAAVAWTAVDSPLLTLQDINRGQWYSHLNIKNGNVYAYVFNNYWWTNYKAGQQGPLTFRFSMTSDKSISDIRAKVFGESVQSPMLSRYVTKNTSAKTSSQKSYVQVKGQGVVIQAMKPARFTNGTIIRLREMSGKNQSIKLAAPGLTFKKAYLCNLAEDKLGSLKVTNGAVDVQCKALGLTTVLLER